VRAPQLTTAVQSWDEKRFPQLQHQERGS